MTGPESAPINTSKSVLMICGSMRKQSFNRQLGEIAVQELQAYVDVHWLDYEDVPLFNQDTEFSTPASVTRIRKEVDEASALWILCPEYNNGLSGLLKNCIDWLSRPISPNAQDSVLISKTVTHCGAGGGSAASAAAAQLEQVLLRAQAHTVYNPYASLLGQ